MKRERLQYIDETSAASKAPASQESEAAVAARVKEAFERGRKQGAEAARQEAALTRAEHEVQIHAALAAFAEEQQSYFRAAEQRCTALTLAIARKILQQQLNFDPLLLRAAVKSALERVREATQIRLFVPKNDADKWRSNLSSASVEVVGDAALRPGELRLETDLGTAELGLDAQLQQIERTLLDLIEDRGALLQ